MYDVTCAVSRDLANHEASVARWETKCEAFDEDILEIVSDEIEKAVTALTSLMDEIITAREQRGLEAYEDNDFEDRVRQALELVEG